MHAALFKHLFGEQLFGSSEGLVGLVGLVGADSAKKALINEGSKLRSISQLQPINGAKPKNNTFSLVKSFSSMWQFGYK